MHAKEYDRPEQVQDELDGEENQSGLFYGILYPVLDNQVKCNPHQAVENGPRGTKHPAWRVERGFYECCIPDRDTGNGEDRTDHADNKRDRNADDEKDAGAKGYRFHYDQFNLEC